MTSRVLVTAATVVGWSGLLLVLYIVLISDVTTLEAVVGGALAVLGGIAAEAVRRAEHPRVHGGRRIAAAVAALPVSLLTETAQLAAAVARGGRTPGEGEVVIRLPADTDPALAAMLLSATPGACVLDTVGADVTVHVLDDAPSAVERALGGRRSR
ncbi:Na+/H+ antiporter subunit E [Streptomyces sp. NBC_01198]|uniref:Na+/H+ antiporter subunit E n=1 Tax=Streptomyces sp. NBC_01198 TaxID=2903769 RepID=UPI002E0F49BA|nr:Na+/H+ antiporter subunit E [Streptomyces sp. NBC_01198]